MLKKIFFLLCILFIASCKEDPGTNTDNGQHIKMLPEGTGSFRFTAYKPLEDKPVNIYYHIPLGLDMTTAPIVMVFHGMSRNADDYRDYWVGSANKYGFMIFSPEFTKELYPTDSDSNSHYNLGNMITNGELNPEDIWTYSIVNPIFDRIKLATGSVNEQFYMFGHSAGSQFVQRCLTFKPDLKTKKAIAANAGWYTMPDSEIEYPYGLKNSYMSGDRLPELFSKDIVVLLGTADTLRTSSLRQTSQADAQGLNRYERGNYYYNWALDYAGDNGLTFGWTLKEVPDVGHSGSAMSVAAANYLFGES